LGSSAVAGAAVPKLQRSTSGLPRRRRTPSTQAAVRLRPPLPPISISQETGRAMQAVRELSASGRRTAGPLVERPVNRARRSGAFGFLTFVQVLDQGARWTN